MYVACNTSGCSLITVVNLLLIIIDLISLCVPVVRFRKKYVSHPSIVCTLISLHVGNGRKIDVLPTHGVVSEEKHQEQEVNLKMLYNWQVAPVWVGHLSR